MDDDAALQQPDLAKNMNVLPKRESYRNEGVKRAPAAVIDKATMRVFEVPGEARP